MSSLALPDSDFNERNFNDISIAGNDYDISSFDTNREITSRRRIKSRNKRGHASKNAAQPTLSTGLLHFYSQDNVGDAAIFASFQRLADQNFLPRLNEWSEKMEAGTDALISVGGDIFNNGRPRLLTRRFIEKLSHLRWAKRRTMSFGQSIPPSCSGISLLLLARHLKQIASVTVRDAASAEKLRKLGVNAVLSVDSAFALTSSDGDTQGARRLFAEVDLKPENTVVFSIRNFNRMYPIDQSLFMARIVATMKILKANGRDVAILIQADVNDDDSDRRIAQQLQTEVDGLKILDPFTGGGTPWRVAFAVVDIANAVIGTRYHTAIFRMAAGKLPIGLWYSNKGEDLHTRFGIPGASAADFDPDLIADMALRYKDVAFNAAPLRERVTRDFRAALAACTDRQGATA